MQIQLNQNSPSAEEYNLCNYFPGPGMFGSDPQSKHMIRELQMWVI